MPVQVETDIGDRAYGRFIDLSDMILSMPTAPYVVA